MWPGVRRAGLPKAEPGAAQRRRLIHIRPDSAVDEIRDEIRAFRMFLREKPTVSQTAPLHLTTSSYPCAVQAARGGTRPPGCTCRIHRVTTQGRALRAYGPELDDVNAVITAADRRGGRKYSAGRALARSRLPPCPARRCCDLLGPACSPVPAEAPIVRLLLGPKLRPSRRKRPDRDLGPGVFPGQTPWSGAGSNCRPSAFQRVFRSETTYLNYLQQPSSPA